jgi:hypothetical protein
MSTMSDTKPNLNTDPEEIEQAREEVYRRHTERRDRIRRENPPSRLPDRDGAK